MDTRRPRPRHAPQSRARPSAPLLFFAPPFPLGATNGQQLTSPASKPSWSLKMVFPRRLGRNSSGGAPWECKSEGYGKIFLFLPNSTKPLTRTQLLYHLAFSSTGGPFFLHFPCSSDLVFLVSFLSIPVLSYLSAKTFRGSHPNLLSQRVH